MRLYFLAVMMAAAGNSIPAQAADVGVSVSIGQPGFYGRLDIGDYPPPQVIYREPRVVRHVQVDRAPVYLNVPPRHSRNWRRYCRHYNACDERVYFVRNTWYEREYVPHYQRRHGDRREERRDERRRDRYDERHDDRRGGDHYRGDNR